LNRRYRLDTITASRMISANSTGASR
jgi:hypothetical protein